MENAQTATETAVLECSFFGREAAFHHIGMAVHSIRAISPSSEPTANELEGVSMAFLRLNGITIELLEPLGGVITDPGQLTEWDQASPHLLRSSGTDGGRRPATATGSALSGFDASLRSLRSSSMLLLSTGTTGLPPCAS